MTEQKVWAWLCDQHEPVTAAAVGQAAGMCERQARRVLERLQERRRATCVGRQARGMCHPYLWVAL